MEPAHEILTIGHSNHPIERFLGLLQGAGVTAVADVRSAPYSRFSPQYRRDPLRSALRAAGIAYVYLGQELGGRPRDLALYRDGMPDYAAMASTDAFRGGVQRVLNGAATHRIALICAEQDPLDCHRCRLVGRKLSEAGATVMHLLADGSSLSQAAAEAILLERAGQMAGDLFASIQ